LIPEYTLPSMSAAQLLNPKAESRVRHFPAASRHH
jgi:hypothetical protein